MRDVYRLLCVVNNHYSSMAEVERDLELIFDIIPTTEELSSKLAAEKM